MGATNRHVDEYWSRGWVVVEGVFGRDLMEHTAARAVQLAQETIAPDAGNYAIDRAPDGSVAGPRKVNQPFLREQAFRDLLLRGPLRDMIRRLIHAAPLLCTDQIFFKPPRHGSPKAYHQDNAYFCCTPGDHLITAWIAMDDVDESNGCLRYIDGSHRGPILPSKPIPGREHDLTPDPSLIDLSKEALALVGKGGVVFHHGGALHCSGENRSDRWRRGYATHWVSPQTTSTTDVVEKAYFRNADLYPVELMS